MILIGAVALAVAAMVSNMDSNYARHNVSAHLQNLGSQVETNPGDNAAMDEILHHLNGNWSFARTTACTVLRKLGPKAAVAIPDLISALNSGNGFVEREAARALGEVAVGRDDAVQPLIEKLKYEDNDVGWFSAESLGKIGRPALPAIPFLEKAAQSENELMREDATEALARLKVIKP